jgi:hypothetical protein
MMMMMAMTMIITTRHELGLDKPVSTPSNSLFKDFSSRLRPFGRHFSISLGILLLLIHVTCRKQFDLYLISFSTTGTTSSLLKFLRDFCGKKWCPVYYSEIIHLDWYLYFLYKKGARQCIMYFYSQKFLEKVNLKVLLSISSIRKKCVSFSFSWQISQSRFTFVHLL